MALMKRNQTGAPRAIVRLMEQAAGGDKPFFIAAGFTKPHLPWVAPKKYFDLYDPIKIQIPQAPAGDRKDIPPLALTRTISAEKFSDAQKREAIAAYHAATSFMDAQVGLLLDAMDRLRLWDNTVVVFWSDHGFHLGEHEGLWRKMTLFEESTRVPLLVYAPGKRAGVASPRLVELIDLYPTLTALAGLQAPQGLEGTSFVPLLSDPMRPWKRAAFTIVARGRGMGRTVRTDRYRYTEWDEGREGVELYDHQIDPREYTNLANDPKHGKTVAVLKQLLHQGWQAAAPPAGAARPPRRRVKAASAR